MENLIIKQLLENYRKKIQLENYNNLDRIRELEDIIGLSMEEYKELYDLYDTFFDNLAKINLLNEILEVIE
ncbi:MAG: hypothetical protein HFJ60_04665 [Clostridia bacterium]|jgi:hypothetical protein|nr:hypothetical protein [Clostridia bacterium]